MAVVLVDGCVAAAALALLLHGRTGEEEEGAACCYSSSLVQPQAERVRHIYCFLQTQQTYEYRAVGCLFCRSSFIVACSLHNNIYIFGLAFVATSCFSFNQFRLPVALASQRFTLDFAHDVQLYLSQKGCWVNKFTY